jgi:predicted nucleic acid-binding protein
VSALLDTTVLIDLLRGSPAAREYLQGLSSVPTCSELTRIEVWRGLRSGERAGAEQLFGKLRWRSLDESVARRAGELGRRWRRSHPGVSVADLAIAATAELLALPLATTNVRHFPMFERLRPAYR